MLLDLGSVHSHVPLVVAGGRVFLGRLPGAACKATRRTPIPLRLWLVSGDALDERDARRVTQNARASMRNRALWAAMRSAFEEMPERRGDPRDRYAQRYPHCGR
jgi:hypothetical protein